VHSGAMAVAWQAEVYWLYVAGG